LTPRGVPLGAESGMAFNFTVVVVLAVLAVVVVWGGLTLQRFVAPRKPMKTKGTVYECGEVPIGSAWFNFNPRFYIIALIFVIFDVEIALTFPIGVVYKKWVEGRASASGIPAEQQVWVALIELSAFILILLIGLAYVWRKGDLEWLKRLWDDREMQRSAGEEASS